MRWIEFKNFVLSLLPLPFIILNYSFVSAHEILEMEGDVQVEREDITLQAIIGMELLDEDVLRMAIGSRIRIQCNGGDAARSITGRRNISVSNSEVCPPPRNLEIRGPDDLEIAMGGENPS
jgi:hypothetical protein